MFKNDDWIKIRGARVHNLQNIDVDIPKNKLTVITGLSGSGKSSLAFDTIYAEGQRRYVESLSNYARQFIGLINKPDVDSIEGLSPAIAIDQRGVIANSRSTVGTITEIYDYLRLLYARAGAPYCSKCQKALQAMPRYAKSANKITVGKNNLKSAAIFSCRVCGLSLTELEPRDFSFNSPQGACPACFGMGSKLTVDPDLVFNKKLTIAQGGIKPWQQINLNGIAGKLRLLAAEAQKLKFDLNAPLEQFNQKQLNLILYGHGEFIGLIVDLEERYLKTDSDYTRKELETYMKEQLCQVCQGQRLRSEYLAVRLGNYRIDDLVNLPLQRLLKLFENWLAEPINGKASRVIKAVLPAIVWRLRLLTNVGLDYLTLSRRADTISGGETQRVRLATQIGANLSGVIYVLDEPSVGLHQRDNDKLLTTLEALRDLQNTVIVVEHDPATMRAADYLIDIGPGAGRNGGRLIACGSAAEICKVSGSLTGQYLAGKKSIEIKTAYRPGNGHQLTIAGATANNLKNIDAVIPLGKFVALTGVSGSGKSTLLDDILAKALNQKFYRAKAVPGQHRALLGLEQIDKVVSINQAPIGRTPRSNPATYTGLFGPLRELYAGLPEARLKNFFAGHFSFNVPGGRCETCDGDGVLKIAMQFLADVYIKCDSCHGRRYQRAILDIYYHDKNIADILEMTVEEAIVFFRSLRSGSGLANFLSPVFSKLQLLSEVGLGYLALGQSATTLSGGEAQRIKLAAELSRRATGKTLYILDEPTTGLHFEDIKKLLLVLNKLVDKGNTVLIIEHNLDVIKSVDWIIDLGPEGGEQGGQIVAQGTPRQVAQNKNSHTGRYLQKVLNL